MEPVAPEKELSGVPIVAEAKVGENWDNVERIAGGMV